MKICVFCSSSIDLDIPLYNKAQTFGKTLGERGHSLIYGAGRIGLMGAMAEAAKKYGAGITGIIPEKLNKPGIVSQIDDELIVTKDMKERKEMLRKTADAFIALPGGFGTLEEILEVITLKQLQYHNKAIVFLNFDGFYDKLNDHFENIFNNNFADMDYKNLYSIKYSSISAIKAIENYKEKKIYDKYLNK